ncbi:MAG: hypothetical protein WCP65_01925 [Bacteroidota bacterium]
MKKGLILLILCYPLYLFAQKEMPKISDKYFYDNKIEGKVKCLEIHGEIFAEGVELLTKEERNEFREINYFDNNIKVFNNTSFRFDSVGNLVYFINRRGNDSIVSIASYKYDSLNRLIQTLRYLPKGYCYFKENYHYDSLNNWVSDKITGIDDSIIYASDITYSDYKIEYLDFTHTKRGGNASFRKVVTYNDDAVVTHYYNSKGMMNRITKEMNDGNKKIIIDTNYNEKDKNSKPTTGTTTTYSKKNKTFYIYETGILKIYKDGFLNEHNDVIKEKIYKNFYHPNSVNRFLLTKTFRYEYDAHGNYTKKIICKDNIPIAVINRTIEYYD